MTRELTGWHVLWIFGGAFAVIIGVNLTLAWQAVATFPGLEVQNSYVASQTFDRDRIAQDALGWTVDVRLDDGLRLDVLGPDGAPVQPQIAEAVLGRPTDRTDDLVPTFAWDGSGFAAPVDLAPGHWVLRLRLLAADGTPFKRNIALVVPGGLRP